jgi:predicted HicB family RNase H-like nuclease
VPYGVRVATVSRYSPAFARERERLARPHYYASILAMVQTRDEKADKVQFNVYLPPELVRRVKHRAIDEGQSLSVLVEHVLGEYLTRHEESHD